MASSDLDVLDRDPTTLRRILFGDDSNWVIEKPKGLVGFLLRFTPLSIETATPIVPITDEELSRRREIECDLEGAWHGLQFLFTGTAWEGDEPACYLIRGGEEIGDDDFELPPRLLRPERVHSFSQFLSGLSDDELRRRYDQRRMVELSIDPRGLWLERPEPAKHGLAVLLESFNELRTFAAKADVAGDGVIVHLG